MSVCARGSSPHLLQKLLISVLIALHEGFSDLGVVNRFEVAFDFGFDVFVGVGRGHLLGVGCFGWGKLLLHK